MTRANIIEALQAKGYEAKAEDVKKNNVTMHGIRISSKKVAPVVYVDQIIEDAERRGLTVDEVAAGIINTYEAHKVVDFDPEELTKPYYIMAHVKIGLQRATDEEITKRPVEFAEDIEQYMYITVDMADGIGAIKLTAKILDTAGIEAAQAWEQAERNTFAETRIESMFSVLAGLIGNMEEYDTAPGMYVISNESRHRGAAAILDKEALHMFGKKHHCEKVVILPSSVHECIILPATECMDIDALTDMVQAVNSTEVDPVEQLADRAFIIEV